MRTAARRIIQPGKSEIAVERHGPGGGVDGQEIRANAATESLGRGRESSEQIVNGRCYRYRARSGAPFQPGHIRHHEILRIRAAPAAKFLIRRREQEPLFPYRTADVDTGM